jgi:hypothetical protein
MNPRNGIIKQRHHCSIFGKMKQLTLILIVIIIAVVLVVPIGLWYLVFEKPIKANPNVLILSNDQLDGWTLTRRYPDEGYEIYSWPEMYTGEYKFAQYDFQNLSAAIGNYLYISISVFNSTSLARDYFHKFFGTYTWNSSSLKLGDDGGRITIIAYGNWNGTDFLGEIGPSYIFREANVIMDLYITTIGTEQNPLVANGTYYEPWMDIIAEKQMSKIDSFKYLVF